MQKKESRVSLDMNRGMLYQIWNSNWTREEYLEYINDPKHLVNPVRSIKMFDNHFLEMFSKTPWWGPLIAWLPKIIFHFLQCEGTLTEIASFLTGLFFWTFAEYTLHRFVFHMEDSKHFFESTTLFTLHFTFHGIHHAFPTDSLRLVLPPIGAYFLYFIFFHFQIKATMPESVAHPFLAGFLLGYLTYDLIHYYFHHADPQEGSLLKKMKSYHM